MASARVEIVERVFELFNELPTDFQARDGGSVEAELLELFDPEVEFVQPPVSVDAGSIGLEEMRKVWNDWLTVWQEQRSRLEDVEERDGRVLALTHDRFLARDGLEVEQWGGAIFSFDGGDRITRLETFVDHESARRAFA